jgi:RNA polymerase sigma-70 factor, ECF subfamily
MPAPLPDSNVSLPAPGERSADSRRSSVIEREVITLFDKFRDPVLRYALSFGITASDGEEITQEVFLALFRHLQSGKSRRNLRGWIFRVAHNLALKQRWMNYKSHKAVEFDWAAAEKRSDPAPNPEDQLASVQRRQRLLAVVRALPEEDRFCLRLRAEGLRYREIASVLNISLGAVSISLTRSLARLSRADEI